MASNIGIFVCGCRGAISDVIDMARLEEELAKLKKSIGARAVHPWLCGPAGREYLRKVVADNGLDCIIIAGCPAAVSGDLADGAGLVPGMVLGLDIREGCAYPHRREPREALRKAVNLIRMWTARARLAEPLARVTRPGVREAVVVGGGLTGMTAALDLAEAGVAVTLIEKEAFLGGNTVRLASVFPRMCDARCGITHLYQRMQETGGVKIMTLSRIESLEGSAGRYVASVVTAPRYVNGLLCNGCGKCAEACPVEVEDEYNFGLARRKAIHRPDPFDPEQSYLIDRQFCPDGCDLCSRVCESGAVDLNREETRTGIRFGSAVVSTGWTPYPAERIRGLGYGIYPDVITAMQMERLLAGDGPTGGRVICPGSGAGPERVVFIQCAGSRDVNHQQWCSAVCCTASIKQALNIKERNPRCRVYIFYNDIRTPGEYEELYVRAQEAGVLFVRTSPAEVTASPSGGLKIIGEDTLMGRVFEIAADLVVLATGITPAGCGFAWPEGQREKREELWDRYGLVSGGGFHTGHKQCFPLEAAAGGIYFAGCCQEPMDMASSVRSALAASGRVLKTAGANVLIPPYVAVVDRAGCDRCKRCVEECPYGAFYIDEQGYPVVDELFCRSCQICMGSCPRQCIIPQGFNIRQQAAMIGAKIRGSSPEEPVAVAFVCENDAYHAVLGAGRRGLTYPANIHVVPVRCIGSVNMVLIKDGISAGIDGFMLAGCKSGECHYVSGSDLAEERLGNIRDTLVEMMLDPDRIKFLRAGIGDAELFAGEAASFIERLKEMGPNPFKNAVVI
ncbi:MAG: FAD-dependent oxidoreductase [Bacillota bacterium]